MSAQCKGCGAAIRAETVFRKIDQSGECWLWLGQISRGGYGKHCHMLAHRLVWLFSGREIPERLCLLHRCDNPPCVNPDHLFIGTQRENMNDMDAKGRRRNSSQRGEANGFPKLTVAIVKDIWRLKYQGMSQHSTARELGITRAAVCDVIRGRTWRHVRDAVNP